MTNSTASKKSKSSQGSSRRPPIEKGRWAAKGTKPLPQQSTIKNIISVVLVHACRKVLFIETEVKITMYSIALFFGSLFFDFLPAPKIYLASNDNFINLYFVKMSWGWNLLIVGTFVYLTSKIYGCGNTEIITKNLCRLFIGTFFWCFWSQFFFGYVEKSTGVCLGKAIVKEKITCISGGFQWHAFDISGHAFILVYINLLIVEEAKAIVGWEVIKELIRIEDHRRSEPYTSFDEKTPLEALNSREFFNLKESYERWTPYIRILFLLMTFMSLLSDVMIACTVIYFHTMPQKVAGGAIAMATWYFTYRFWFKREGSPGLPGNGLFKYQHIKEKSTKEHTHRRRSSISKTHIS